MTEPTTEPTTEESGEGIPIRKGGPIVAENTTPPPPTGVILIPPLGLEKVAKLTDGFKEWWKKHGPNSTQAVIDAIAIIAEVLKPTPPPATPAQPATPKP
jgi:hypothetical protein